MSPRIVFHYRGHGRPPAGDIHLIESVAHVVDRSSRMLLVDLKDGSLDGSLAALMNRLPQWQASPVTTVSLPDTQHRISRSED